MYFIPLINAFRTRIVLGNTRTEALSSVLLSPNSI